MGRAPRNATDGIFHVTTQGAGPSDVFLDDVDRTLFCSLLIQQLVRQSWACLSFCLMTTHFHLLLEIPDESLPVGMQRLNGFYARNFNLRHGRKGHLFGERYYAVRAESDQHMLELLRYIARNPVRAGMCTRPEDWYWSSYRGCIVPSESAFPFVDSSRLTAYFGSSPERARPRLRAFVDAADAD